MNANDWIEHLGLTPHPEGGFFKETYRAENGEGERAASTGIYFLLRAGDVSHFHRIDADEMWHFYAGDALIVHMIDEAGEHTLHRLGRNAGAGEVFQAVVPKGIWFGAEVAEGGAFALVGCTVAPGFEFAGFEMAERGEMLAEFPAHRALIERLT